MVELQPTWYLRTVFSEWADIAPVAGVEKGPRSSLFHLSVFPYLPFVGFFVCLLVWFGFLSQLTFLAENRLSMSKATQQLLKIKPGLLENDEQRYFCKLK